MAVSLVTRTSFLQHKHLSSLSYQHYYSQLKDPHSDDFARDRGIRIYGRHHRGARIGSENSEDLLLDKNSEKY